MLFGSAFLVGFSGAIMPGPVFTATIAESMRRGFRAGPLIVLGHAILELTLLVAIFAGLAGWIRQPVIQGALGLVGGAVLVFMGVQMIRTSRAAVEEGMSAMGGSDGAPRRGSWRGPVTAGIVLSVSNPYWAFWWATIGLNFASQALTRGAAGLGSFYVGHILSDLTWYSLVAAAVASGRHIIPRAGWRGLIVLCGVALIGLGLWFAWDGTRVVGWRG